MSEEWVLAVAALAGVGQRIKAAVEHADSISRLHFPGVGLAGPAYPEK